MAAQDLYPEVIASPQDWSDDSWNTVDTGGGAIEDPGVGDAGDNAWFSEKSGNVTLTANTATFEDLDMSKGAGYAATLIMAAYDIDADGDVTLEGTLTGDSGAIIYCGGSLMLMSGLAFDATGKNIAVVMDAGTGAHTIESNDVVMGALTIDDDTGDATFTLADAMSCGAFVLTDGIFSTANFAWSVAGITGTGGTLNFGDSLVVAGGYDIDLDNITATAGAATLIADNVDTGGGSLTMTDDLIITGNFELESGGTLTMATKTLTVSGDYINSGGTMVTPGKLTMTGATVSLKSGTSNYPASLALGATAGVTLGAASRFVGGLDVPAEATLALGNYELRACSASAPDANSFRSEGEVTAGTGIIVFYFTSSTSNSPILNFGSVGLTVLGTSSDTWTQTGRLTCGALTIKDTTAGQATIFTLAGTPATMGAVTLGASGNKSGILVLGPHVYTIASVTIGHDDDANSALTLANSNILLSGILNGDSEGTNGITVTSVGANIVGTGASAEIKQVDSDAVIHCWGLIDGGDNNQYVCHESSLGGPAVNVGCGLAIAA